MRRKVAFLTVNVSFHVKIIDSRGKKIQNHHMSDHRHIDMFSRTESHRKIDWARLENHKISFKPSEWGEKLSF